MKKLVGICGLLVALSLACRPAAATILLTDNFDVASGSVDTFNDTLAQTQGGTLATVTYNLTNGINWVAQHGNGGHMIVANSSNGSGFGNVSLNHNFATDANAAGSPLEVSFVIASVTGYSDPGMWVQFNIAGGQNLDPLAPSVGIAATFSQNGILGLLSGGSSIGSASTWAGGDLVSVKLSDTAGTGSAFDGNGSKATVSIGGTMLGTYTLGQLSSAFVTFSGFNYAGAFFGVGEFDNLSISTVPAAVPEIDPAGMGSVVALVTGALGLLERRRRGTA